MLKILVVEDDRELRRLFAHVLIKNGYSVKEVSNGRYEFNYINKEKHLLIKNKVLDY